MVSVVIVAVATGDADVVKVRASSIKIILLVGVHLGVVSLLGVILNLFLMVKKARVCFHGSLFQPKRYPTLARLG